MLVARPCSWPENCPWTEPANSTPSLHRLIPLEPFASVLLHLQTITTVVVWIVVIAWCIGPLLPSGRQ